MFDIVSVIIFGILGFELLPVSRFTEHNFLDTLD